MTGESFVPIAAFEALQAELMQTRQELRDAKARLDALEGTARREGRNDFSADKVERAFDEVDANGDGVLTLEEFRKGYALLTGDAVAQAFEQMDADGNGTVDRDEFQNGFAALTSDTARAERARQKVEAAVSQARIAAVQEAALNLAEAQLMDDLFGELPPGKTRWPEEYKPAPGRTPLPQPPSRKQRKGSRGRPAQMSAAPVAIAICTGSSCEQRCSAAFEPQSAFASLAAAADDAVAVVKVNCMNQCKRGPAARIVSDGELLTVSERMGAQEMKRKAFHNVASVARAEAIFAVAQRIGDGSLADEHGAFTTLSHGPLPPAAQ